MWYTEYKRLHERVQAVSVTIKEIAEYVGVSPATVSRVLSGRGAHLISEATRQRVWQAAEELGYYPNLSARSLVTGRTGIVALWMSHLFTSFHARVVQLVEEHLHQQGYDTLIRCVCRLSGAAWHGTGEWMVSWYTKERHTCNRCGNLCTDAARP